MSHTHGVLSSSLSETILFPLFFIHVPLFLFLMFFHTQCNPLVLALNVSASLTILMVPFFVHNQKLCAVKEPSDSVPTTQSPKREVGTLALWLLAKVR